MIETTEQIHYECTSCMSGMELYTDKEGVKRKHGVSFEAPLGKFSHIKKGNFIPEKACPDCEKDKLIRV